MNEFLSLRSIMSMHRPEYQMNLLAHLCGLLMVKSNETYMVICKTRDGCKTLVESIKVAFIDSKTLARVNVGMVESIHQTKIIVVSMGLAHNAFRGRAVDDVFFWNPDGIFELDEEFLACAIPMLMTRSRK